MKLVTTRDKVVKSEFMKKIKERLILINLVKDSIRLCLDEVNPKKAFSQDLPLPEEFSIHVDMSEIIKKQQKIQIQLEEQSMQVEQGETLSEPDEQIFEQYQCEEGPNVSMVEQVEEVVESEKVEAPSKMIENIPKEPTNFDDWFLEVRFASMFKDEHERHDLDYIRTTFLTETAAYKVIYSMFLEKKAQPRSAVFSNLKITKVLDVKYRKYQTIDYPQFVREDQRCYMFTEADFSQLDWFDFWDLRCLILPLEERNSKYRKALVCIHKAMTRVIRVAVHMDFHIAFDWKRTEINLTAPIRYFEGIENYQMGHVLSYPEDDMIYIYGDQNCFFGAK